MSRPNRIDRIDGAIYRVERAVCIGVLATMVTLVGVGVLHRVFVRAGGVRSKMESLALKLVGSPSGAPSWLGPLLLVVVFWGLAYAAVRQRTVRQGEQRTPRLRALALSGGGVGLLGGLLYLLTTLVPSFGWPQPLSVALMVWVGFLGASMATHDRRHLSLEMGSKIWPKKWLPALGGVARLVTTAFCLFFAYLAWRSLRAHYDEGQRFTFEIQIRSFPEQPLRLPEWVSYAVIPYTFTMMTLRFVKQAWQAFHGIGLEAPGDVPAGMLEDAEGGAKKDEP